MSENVLDIFQPILDLDGPPTVMPGLMESLEVHILPETAGFYARLAWAFVMMMLGSITTQAPPVWKWYLMSYSVALFPAFSEFITPGVKTISVTDIMVGKLTRIGKILDEFRRVSARKADNGREDGSSVIEEVNAIISEIRVVSRFAQFGNTLWNHAAAANIHTIYGHYSLVVYLAGKVITPDNERSIMESRPRAIISKYQLGVDGRQFFLNNGNILSRYAHSGIWRAWLEMPGFRVKVLAEIVRSVSSGKQLANDVMNVTVSLMEWTNMQHATFCARLISRHPWIGDFAPLKEAYSEFLASRKAIKAYPRSVIPYLKLIYGDRVKLFPRARLLPLIECALSELRKTESSLAQYHSDPSQAAVVALFQAEVSRRELIDTVGKAKERDAAVRSTADHPVPRDPETPVVNPPLPDPGVIPVEETE